MKVDMKKETMYFTCKRKQRPQLLNWLCSEELSWNYSQKSRVFKKYVILHPVGLVVQFHY